MKIIRKRERITNITYYRSFDWRDEPGSGFNFPCDKDGNIDIDIDLMQPAGKENYHKCINAEYDVIDNGIEIYNNSYMQPAIGICSICKTEVQLYSSTNTCEKCGTDYNLFGQELTPRSQWGYETGESEWDILNPSFK